MTTYPAPVIPGTHYFKSNVSPDAGNKGSVLLIVLWALFLLGALAVAINAYIIPHIELAGKIFNRALTYNLAKAAVKRAVLEIKKDSTASFDSLNETWSNNEAEFKDAALGEGSFSIISFPEEPARYGLADEERKININNAPHEVLKALFEITAGASSQDAAAIADSILDWRDGDDDAREDGAESIYYANLSSGYPCRNAEFQVLEELLLVKGVSKEIFDKAKDRITIYSGKAVNINTADSVVLQALGIDNALIEKIMHFRRGYDGEEATADDNAFEEAGSIASILNEKEKLASEEINLLNKIYGQGLLCVRSDNFSANCFGMRKGKTGSSKITFVFNRGGAIKYWRQD